MCHKLCVCIPQIFLVLAACLLCSSCVAKQSQDAQPLIWNNAGHGSLTPPPLKLDPVLRRALLRALTQLELEAQRKAAGGDAAENTPTVDSVNDSQEQNIKRDLEELLGNYENTIKSSEEPQPPVVAKESHEMIVLDEQSSQPADDVSVIDYEVPGDKTKSPDDLNRQETTSFLDKPQESAIFYQDQQKESEKETGIEENKPQTDSPPQADIQSNVIPSSTQLTDTDKGENIEKRGSEQDSNAIETSFTGNNAVVRSKDLAVGNNGRKLDLDDQDVSIFQAPLVAAFTLQQDEKGNPKSVVPLLRRPQPSLVTQQQQRLQQQQFQIINPTQSFPTLPTDQQHRFQPQTFNPAGQQPLFQRQSLLPRDQQLRFQPQPFQITREQELERKTRLLEQQLLQLQQQQRFQQQQQFQQQELHKQQQHLEQERLRQRQEQLFLEEQQRLRLQQSSFVPLEPPPNPQHLRSQRQETGTSIVDFQQSVGFQFRQPQNNVFQQQFVPSTFNQGPNPATDFGSNNVNSFRQPSQPPSVNSQLQNLLYQSGVAGDLQINGASPQEDLNIVSKILSLNHEGRENRASRETIQTPSRFISPPLP